MKKGLSMPDLTRAEGDAQADGEEAAQKPEGSFRLWEEGSRGGMPSGTPPLNPTRPPSFRHPGTSFCHRPASPVSAEGGRGSWSLPRVAVGPPPLPKKISKSV